MGFVGIAVYVLILLWLLSYLLGLLWSLFSTAIVIALLLLVGYAWFADEDEDKGDDRKDDHKPP